MVLRQLNRVMYDASHGIWKVLFNGKPVKQEFKNSQTAYDFLQKLIHKTVPLEY